MDASLNAPVAAGTALPETPDLAGLQPIERIRRRWPLVLGAALSLLMVAALAYELLGSGLAGLSRTIPRSPFFWISFALFYLGPPTFDFVIFRKLWRIPASGMIALHKKRISNEVLIGYSGEAYFYAWARQRTKMVAAPFGAVKDVAILSAMAGHAVTLAIVAIALPFGLQLLTQGDQRMLIGSVALLVAMIVPFVIFSKRVFSLARPTLWWIFGVQCARIVSGTIFLAFAWYFALPDVSVLVWLFLVAGRLLVSRLPLVPNKDLLFANFAILLIGQGEAVSELLAFTAALTLLVHVVLIGGFGLQSLMRKQ